MAEEGDHTGLPGATERETMKKAFMEVLSPNKSADGEPDNTRDGEGASSREGKSSGEH